MLAPSLVVDSLKRWQHVSVRWKRQRFRTRTLPRILKESPREVVSHKGSSCLIRILKVPQPHLRYWVSSQEEVSRFSLGTRFRHSWTRGVHICLQEFQRNRPEAIFRLEVRRLGHNTTNPLRNCVSGKVVKVFRIPYQDSLLWRSLPMTLSWDSAGSPTGNGCER